MMAATTNEGSVARVFISYAWTAQEWVIELAQKLLDASIDVTMDIYDLKPGQDKYQFMESMVHDPSITKVLMICDKDYVAKADTRTKGVGDETQIISPKIYGETAQIKFIPVIRQKDEAGNAHTPNYLKSRIYIDLSEPDTYEENFERLVREILNKPQHTKPDRAKTPPSYITDDSQPTSPTRHKFSAFSSAIRSGKPHVVGLARDYLNAVLGFFEGIKVWRKPNQQSLADDVKSELVNSIDAFLPLRDEYIEFVSLVCTYGSEKSLYETIQRFFYESARFLKRTHDQDSGGEIFADNYHFLIGELFMYTIATLISNSRHAETNIFLSAAYQHHLDIANQNVSGYDVFEPYVENIARWSRTRNSARDERIVITMLRERANRQDITFTDLVDVDFVLCLRDFLHNRYSYSSWVGQIVTGTTMRYYGVAAGIPIVVRAMAHNDFIKLCSVLDVVDKNDLKEKFEAACAYMNNRNTNTGKDRCEIYRSMVKFDMLDIR